MDENAIPKQRKRLVCRSNAVLTNAVSEYAAANGHASEGSAVEALLREALTSRGHLPAKSQ